MKTNKEREIEHSPIREEKSQRVPRRDPVERESDRNLPSPRAKNFSPTDECVQVLSPELNLEE